MKVNHTNILRCNNMGTCQADERAWIREVHILHSQNENEWRSILEYKEHLRSVEL